jgi:integrase
VIRAALTFAADGDERIVNRRAWQQGAADLPNAERSRNVILPDATVRRIVAEAHAACPAFGLLVEVAAVTGARIGQLARMEVQDLQDGDAPRLLIPSSRKGRGTRQVLRRPTPIGAELASRLLPAQKRAATAPLLIKASGEPWRKGNHDKPFERIVKRCGLDPAAATIYALRHSSIVRQLLAGVPTRVVAAAHDTSVLMIERTYSRHIGDHADALVRGALLTLA